MRTCAISPSMIARETHLILSTLMKHEMTGEIFVNVENDYLHDKYNYFIKYAGNAISIDAPYEALSLSLKDFGKQYILPKVKKLPMVRKVLAREAKLLHMKRKLSCKSKIHLVH